jgi:MFS transporter, DHA2 family, multidrug resistance protein
VPFGYAFVATQIPHRVTLHRGHLAEHLTLYDGGTMNAIDRLTGFLANSGLPPGEAEQRALKLLDSNVYRQATMMAFNDMFWMMGGLFVLGLPLLFLVGSSVQRRRSGKDVATGAKSSGTEKVRQVS